MSRGSARFLWVFVAWTTFVWVVFIRNMVKDKTHSAAFKEIHIALAVVSLAFAAGTVVVLRRERARRVGAGSETVDVAA